MMNFVKQVLNTTTMLIKAVVIAIVFSIPAAWIMTKFDNYIGMTMAIIYMAICVGVADALMWREW